MNNIELNRYLQGFLKTDYTAFLSAFPEPAALRVNTIKASEAEIKNRLYGLNIGFSDLPFKASGMIVPEDHLPLSHTLDFFRGLFFYQGISSQIPALILDPQPGETVLDIAAAPGSKAAQIGALMKNRGILVANDIARSRLQPLNVNTQRTGLINHLIFNHPGERMGHLFPEYFDKILVDAPCTGLGTLNTHDEIWYWWSRDKLAKLRTKQKQLLVSAIKALKTGGELVYSTCSIAPEENEEVVNHMIQHYPIEVTGLEAVWYEMYDRAVIVHEDHNYHDSIRKGLRIYPHKHGQEGFFVIKLRKTDSVSIHKKHEGIDRLRIYKCSEKPVDSILEDISKNWGIPLSYWENHLFYLSNQRLWMFNQDMESVPVYGFMNGGLLLAEERLHLWRLTNQSAQFLGNRITKKRIALRQDEMKQLFSEGVLQYPGLENGYHALIWNENPVAILYSARGQCKIRLPHHFRLVL